MAAKKCEQFFHFPDILILLKSLPITSEEPRRIEVDFTTWEGVPLKLYLISSKYKASPLGFRKRRLERCRSLGMLKQICHHSLVLFSVLKLTVKLFLCELEYRHTIES